MQLFRDLAALPASAKGAVVAIGNCDGLHLGHQAILKQTLQAAKTLGVAAAVMSFEPHPREFFSPNTPRLRLMRLIDKIRVLREMGFSYLFLPRFNAQLAATSADEFVTQVLVGQLGVRQVVTGENFYFGARRAGDSSFLASMASQHGFIYQPVAPVSDEGGIISSSRIRSLLAEGKVEEAGILLGQPYRISGHVTHGDKRGRQLGFPTANLPIAHYFLPRHGVYKVSVQVGWENYRGVANIGIRPTFGGKKPQAEIHLFDFSGDIYGKTISVALDSFLRDEQTFSSIDALKKQIAEDCRQANNDKQ